MRSVLFLLLGACGGGSKSAPPPVSNQPPATEPPPVAVATTTRPACADVYDATDRNCTLATMEYYSASMCTCKDKACADKVHGELTTWGTTMAKSAGPIKDHKPSPEVVKKSADTMTKYVECMTKLAPPSSPDPCAGGADPCGG